MESISIDEAFLDVTGSYRLFGALAEIVQRIRKEVRDETGLGVSAGVASNKFLAKLASERAKPDGLLVLQDEQVEMFLLPLPVGALWGGGTTEAQLLKMGIRTVADLPVCG